MLDIGFKMSPKIEKIMSTICEKWVDYLKKRIILKIRV